MFAAKKTGPQRAVKAVVLLLLFSRAYLRTFDPVMVVMMVVSIEEKWRISYSSPPLQLMPKHDEELAPLIRGVFLPQNGEVWAECDVSQQEFRMIVHYAARHRLSKATNAVEKFRTDPNTDFHELVAGWTGRDRQTSKNTNFAKAYGAGVSKFAAMIGKSEQEAAAIFEQYDRELPFVAQLSTLCERAVWRKGYLTLYSGARRHWNLPWGQMEEGRRAVSVGRSRSPS